MKVIPVLERRGQSEVITWKLLLVRLCFPTYSIIPEERWEALFDLCLRICLMRCAQPFWERGGEAVARWAGLGCWYSLDNGLLGYLIFITKRKRRNKLVERKSGWLYFSPHYSPLVLAKFCSDCYFLTWEHEELLVRELSLMFSFVEREKKIAGSQVTMKILLVCSDTGKNYPLQCSVKC